jgi:hypothetical protein
MQNNTVGATFISGHVVRKTQLMPVTGDQRYRQATRDMWRS